MDETTVHNIDDLDNQLNRAKRELSVLYDISHAMRTTLELDHIMYIILTGVTSHTGLGFNRAILFLVSPNKSELEAKMAIAPESREHAGQIWSYIKESNQDLEDLIAHEKLTAIQKTSTLYKSIKKFKISLSDQDNHLFTRALRQGSVMHITKEEIAQHQDDPFFKFFQTSEMVIIPLKAKEKVNGLIIADNVFTQKPITDEDIKILEMIGNQAGLAIENSRLYEVVVHKSHTDSLTDLWNHGFFQYTLSAEIEKARNDKYPVSLLMIDLDNFKQFNDQYGHQIGDQVLCRLSKILKNSSRDSDCVCRYGGEEFSIILPNIGKEQAYEIAERLREEIAGHKFSQLNGYPDLGITVSIGLASFPDDADQKEDLISKADKAMYVAKFSGKNQTCLAEKPVD